MEANTFAISVLQGDGSLVEQSRTLYRSHYGPMLDPTVLNFPLSWDESTAYTIFDLNADNGRLLEPFLAMAKADSVIALREVFRTVGGVPWNNTMATDSTGQTFYADTTLVPNLSDAAESAFLNLLENDLVTGIAYSNGLVLLDGSDPLFTVEQDPSATLAGAIPFSEAPQMLRQDFVANANDSYWLSNPAQPLTGYSVLYGETETPRSLRTRLGLKQILESTSWTRQGLKDLLFANRSFTNEMWRDVFTTYCSGFTEAQSSTGDTVNIEQACIALTNWDGRYNLDSYGAILNRELLSSASSTGLLNGQSYYTVPFDAEDAVSTPSGLSDAGQAYLLTQLAVAVLRLQSVGIAPDAPLGDHQYTTKGSERIAIHGGLQHSDGAYNITKYDDRTSLNSSLLPGMPRAEEINEDTFLTRDGYLINYGAMALS